MTKIDENGWVKTNGVSLAVTDKMVLLSISDDGISEIDEIDLSKLLEASSMYFTRWEFLKIKLSWIWAIVKMKA